MKTEKDFLIESYYKYKELNNSSISLSDYEYYIFHNHDAVLKWYEDKDYKKFVKNNKSQNNRHDNIKDLDGEILSIIDKPYSEWDRDDHKIYEWFKKHKQYRKHYWIGIFLWPLLTVFLIPILICTILSFIEMGIQFFDFSSSIGSGLIFGIISGSFISVITFPLGCIIGAYIYPAFLKDMIFDENMPYSEDVITFLRLSPDDQRRNVISLTAGTVIGSKILKK